MFATSARSRPFCSWSATPDSRQSENPVLQGLSRQVSDTSAPHVGVVFLGDNAYPRGLPPEGYPGYADALVSLDAQLRFRGTARAFFVPGNHDWANGGKDGLRAVWHQEEYVEKKRGAVMIPSRGCPGPESKMLGPIRIVALDTQWWLHGYERPHGASLDCIPAATAREVLDALERLLEDDTAINLVVAHYPLRSTGVHAGHFGWRSHLFPLTDWNPWLAIPVPIIGSVYPMVRATGIVTRQDLAHGDYRKMSNAVYRAIAYASGHDHHLEVTLSRRSGPVHLLSGGGSPDMTTHVSPRAGSTGYAHAGSGFMRLDVGRQGSIRLGVFTTGPTPKVWEVYSLCLRGGCSK